VVQFTDTEEEVEEGFCMANVAATYLHGILDSSHGRRVLLGGGSSENDDTDEELNRFAAHLSACGLNAEFLQSIVCNNPE
jgi:hypothetical protein